VQAPARGDRALVAGGLRGLHQPAVVASAGMTERRYGRADEVRELAPRGLDLCLQTRVGLGGEQRMRQPMATDFVPRAVELAQLVCAHHACDVGHSITTERRLQGIERALA